VERARRRNNTRAGRNGHWKTDENRFEQESRAFFARARRAYLAIAAREAQRVVVVNARGTARETHARILEIVRQRLKLAAKTA
jgi:dTMP kinase